MNISSLEIQIILFQDMKVNSNTHTHTHTSCHSDGAAPVAVLFSQVRCTEAVFTFPAAPKQALEMCVCVCVDALPVFILVAVCFLIFMLC